MWKVAHIACGTDAAGTLARMDMAATQAERSWSRGHRDWEAPWSFLSWLEKGMEATGSGGEGVKA